MTEYPAMLVDNVVQSVPVAGWLTTLSGVRDGGNSEQEGNDRT